MYKYIQAYGNVSIQVDLCVPAGVRPHDRAPFPKSTHDVAALQLYRAGMRADVCLPALRGWAAGARRSASTKGAEAEQARQATRQRRSSWLAHLDPVYLRNRVLYWLAANPPLDDVGSSDTDAAARAELLRAPPQRWDISQLPHQQSVASSAVDGLYVVRGFYNDEEVQAIRAAVHHITNGWSIQGQTEGVPFREPGQRTARVV